MPTQTQYIREGTSTRRLRFSTTVLCVVKWNTMEGNSNLIYTSVNSLAFSMSVGALCCQGNSDVIIQKLDLALVEF